MTAKDKILLIGYGNPGRQDDGLGPAMVVKLEKQGIEHVVLDSDYQLTVEKAYEIAEYQMVIFVDAVLEGIAPYSFHLLDASDPGSVSSHSLSPQTVLYLAKILFQAKTKAYLLGIKGYEFDQFEEKLSEKAEGNLNQAYDFLIQKLKADDFFYKKVFAKRVIGMQ